MATWTLGTTEDGLVIQITAEQNGDDVNFTVQVLEGSAHVNAIYWSDADEAGGESAYSGFVNNDGTLTRSENSVNMNGTGVLWDGGHLLSLPGLRGSTAQGPEDDPIEFTVAGVTIADFETLGVRATSTSTEEGSIKWVAQPDEGEPEPEPEPAIVFWPTQEGNSRSDVGLFSVSNSEETFTFSATAVNSDDDEMTAAQISVNEDGSLSFGSGANSPGIGTFKVTVSATGSGGTEVVETFTVLLGQSIGNPTASADIMPDDPNVLFVLDNGGKNILLGMNGNDKLTGSDGNDYLLGGNHNDTIDGGGGDDIIWGGEGADALWGGDGNDIFAYLQAEYVLNEELELELASESSPSAFDTIHDWDNGSNVIHLAFIDADTGTLDNDAFAWGGEDAAVVANSITWYWDDGNTIIQGDVDGDDTAAELHIVLIGEHTLSESDFIL